MSVNIMMIFFCTGYGVWTDGTTTYINASTCNRRYKPINAPIVFDYPIPEGHSKDELLQSVTADVAKATL